MLTETRSIGVPTRLASVPEISRPASQYFSQHVPTIDAHIDKIIMITNNNKWTDKTALCTIWGYVINLCIYSVWVLAQKLLE